MTWLGSKCKTWRWVLFGLSKDAASDIPALREAIGNSGHAKRSRRLSAPVDLIRRR